MRAPEILNRQPVRSDQPTQRPTEADGDHLLIAGAHVVERLRRRGAAQDTWRLPSSRTPPLRGVPSGRRRGSYTLRMNETLPSCPQCSSAYTYEMGALLICPECGHEWSLSSAEPVSDAGGGVIRDSVGNVLADGDTVTVIKSLKVKGSPTGIKAGTKVRNIRLMEGVDGHDIDCKIDGFGAMQLKSSVVRKA